MPLYSKIAVQQYGDDPDTTAEASLDELRHESKRLTSSEKEEVQSDPLLLYNSPKQWHRVFIDELLRPDDWKPPAGRVFPIKPSEVLRLCDLVEARLQAEPTLLEVQAPVKVIGDIHGQFADLMHLFRVYGTPSRLGDISYLDYLAEMARVALQFLGDYVDRGEYSLETICLLFALKVEFPTQVHLLRGNHETTEVNSRYGFLAECKGRLGPVEGWKVWRRINEVFYWLPLAARIDSKILCMHGGISQELTSVSQIASLKRPLSFNEDFTPPTQLAYQLLWNDPNANDAVYGSHASSRGSDIQTFSAQQVEEFCQANDLELIVRAHQCVKDGFERFARGRLVTVFSAANYCGRYDNAGALLLVGRDHVVVPKLIRPQARNPRVKSGVQQFSPRAVARRQRASLQQSGLGPGRERERKPSRSSARQREAAPAEKGAGAGAEQLGAAATFPRGGGAHRQPSVPQSGSPRSPQKQPVAEQQGEAEQQGLISRHNSQLSEQQPGTPMPLHIPTKQPSSRHEEGQAQRAQQAPGSPCSPQRQPGSRQGKPSPPSSPRSPQRQPGSQHHEAAQQQAASASPRSPQRQPPAAEPRSGEVGEQQLGSRRGSSAGRRSKAAQEAPSGQSPSKSRTAACEGLRPQHSGEARADLSQGWGSPATSPKHVPCHDGPKGTASTSSAASAGRRSANPASPSSSFTRYSAAAAAAAAADVQHAYSAEGRSSKGPSPLVFLTVRAGSLPKGIPASPCGQRPGCGDAAVEKLRGLKAAAVLGCSGAQEAVVVGCAGAQTIAAVGVTRTKDTAKAGWADSKAAVEAGCAKVQSLAQLGCAGGVAGPGESLVKAWHAAAVGWSAGAGLAAEALTNARDAAAAGWSIGVPAAAEGLAKARGAVAVGCSTGAAEAAAALTRARDAVAVSCTAEAAAAAAAAGLSRAKGAASAGLAKARATAAVGCTGGQAVAAAGLAKARATAAAACSGAQAKLAAARDAAVVGCTGAPGRPRARGLGLPLVGPCFGLGPACGVESPTGEQGASSPWAAKLAAVKAAAAAAHARLLDVSISPLECFERPPAEPLAGKAAAAYGGSAGCGEGGAAHADGPQWPAPLGSVVCNPLFDSVEGAGSHCQAGGARASQEGRRGSQPIASMAAVAGMEGGSAAQRLSPYSGHEAGAVARCRSRGRDVGCSSSGTPPNAHMVAAVRRSLAVSIGLYPATLMMNYGVLMVLTRLAVGCSFSRREPCGPVQRL